MPFLRSKLKKKSKVKQSEFTPDMVWGMSDSELINFGFGYVNDNLCGKTVYQQGRQSRIILDEIPPWYIEGYRRHVEQLNATLPEQTSTLQFNSSNFVWITNGIRQ